MVARNGYSRERVKRDTDRLAEEDFYRVQAQRRLAARQRAVLEARGARPPAPVAAPRRPSERRPRPPAGTVEAEVVRRAMAVASWHVEPVPQPGPRHPPRPGLWRRLWRRLLGRAAG